MFGDTEDENVESEMNPHNPDQEEEEEDNDEPTTREDEAEEVADSAAAGDTSEVVKPKRVLKNPLPKLDATRLMGPRGVGVLQSTFKDVKFKGKGYEKEDLTLLMKRLEHWAHRLFPRLPFDDTVKQIEKLGTKKTVQNMMKRIRLDMYQTDEANGVLKIAAAEDETQPKEVREIDVFDELLGKGPFADNNSPTVLDSPRQDTLTLTSSNSPKRSVNRTLTAEQCERMEKNRLLALEKRKSKHSQQSKENVSWTDDFGVTGEEYAALNQMSRISAPVSASSRETENAVNSKISNIETSSDNNNPLDGNLDETETSVGDKTDEDILGKTNDKHSNTAPMEVDTFNDVCSVLDGKGSRERSGTVEEEIGLREDKEQGNRCAHIENIEGENVFTEDDILSFINTEEFSS